MKRSAKLWQKWWEFIFNEITFFILPKRKMYLLREEWKHYLRWYGSYIWFSFILFHFILVREMILDFVKWLKWVWSCAIMFMKIFLLLCSQQCDQSPSHIKAWHDDKNEKRKMFTKGDFNECKYISLLLNEPMLKHDIRMDTLSICSSASKIPLSKIMIRG